METQITETPADFRLFLQEELVRRIRTKPGYSMRAFARFLGIDSSRLSKMLRGERPIKPHFIESFGQRVGLSPDKIENYKVITESKKSRRQGEYRTEYQQIALDTFEIVSDWQHNAILELMRMRDFKNETQWIAKQLKIQASEVNTAIERLQRVGMLKINEDGSWRDLTAGYTTHDMGKNYTTYAHKRYQEQIGKQSLEALNEVPIEKRDHSSMTVAINMKRIDEAKEMLKEFRRKMASHFEQDAERDAVYQISLSLFPITDVSNIQVQTSQPNEGVSNG